MASATFVSTRAAFVLGTAPCTHAPCTSIARTLDRGVVIHGHPYYGDLLGQLLLTDSGGLTWHAVAF